MTVPPPPPIVRMINHVRHAHHLPVAHWTTAYSRQLRAALVRHNDPLVYLGNADVSGSAIWGEAGSAKDVLNIWVNRDSWLGSATMNLDCVSPNATACNDHRRAVLTNIHRHGARLFIDAIQRKSKWGTEVAAVLVWKKS